MLSTRTFRAFTLLESLITLSLVSFLMLTTSGAVQSIFRQVETKLFFMEFEQVYRETQRLSASQQQEVGLRIGRQAVVNPLGHYALPRTVTPEKELTVVFNQAGGNSSLAKIVFQTPEGRVSYQLYLGSGQYQKKTE